MLAYLHGYQALEALFSTEIDRKQRIAGLLYLVQLISAFTVATGFATFSQRPDVYDGDLLVDQQHTTSLLDLFSFSWNRVVFDVAKERKMELEDIPNLDFETRSRNLEARFLETRNEKSPLWRQLIRNYARELALQWTLTLAVAFLSLFPQVVLYNFLSRIENSHGHATTDPTVFIWVLGLLLSQLLQVGVNNWIKWITTSRLELPVGSLLQSLVFSKALKQYETAPPGQKVDKEKDSKPGSQNGVTDANDKNRKKDGAKAKGNEPETRQSVINHMKLDR